MKAIIPSATEASLFRLLLDVASTSGVTLRVAGGWVRDKLLNFNCHDLDIAIDSVSGYDFAVSVNNHLAMQNMPTARVAKILSNPEKSKHLETATMKIFGLDVDFVNLRKETYGDTRVPTMVHW